MADDPVVPPTDPAPALTPSADSASTNAAAAATSGAAPVEGAAGSAADAVNDQAVIDELLKQANFDDPTAGAGAAASASSDANEISLPDASTFDLPAFQQVMSDAQVSS